MKSHYDGLEFNKSKAKKSSNENVFAMEANFTLIKHIWNLCTYFR